ncbi:IS4 family transposase [Meiothermus sp. PNK-Is4]|nr:IS4 family transposase [Meiothermus sp. Pnk-1]RYM36182.1 IS4 family transposase [Meiothermus sp. PNK-Is4]
MVEIYRRRWEIEGFIRLLKVGLGLEGFLVCGLVRIRKVVAVVLGLAMFVWELQGAEGSFKAFLLELGGKLGLAGERDGPYLLLRGLVRLLNHQVIQEHLERARKGKKSCG